MKREEILTVLREHYSEITDRFGVKSVRLFGSKVRGEGGPGSDVDILVDFGGAAGFAQYMDLLFYLEDLLGTTVDLVTARGLRDELRSAIEREAVRVT